MSLVVRDVMFDCATPPAWPGSGVLYYTVRSRGAERVSGSACRKESAIGAVFRHVADAKQVKNRLHLHLSPVDGTLATELERLTAIGATILARHARGFGLGWAVLADPEGNEFCVQSGDAEVDAVRERPILAQRQLQSGGGHPAQLRRGPRPGGPAAGQHGSLAAP